MSNIAILFMIIGLGLPIAGIITTLTIDVKKSK